MRYDQRMHEKPAPKNHGAPYWLVVAAGYVIVAALGLLSISNEFRHIDDTIEALARERGTVLFRLIELTRDWNAQHGGIYAPVTAKTQPNEYLEHPRRDLETTDGMHLTMINPAFMTRQIAEIAEKIDGVKFHITSLNPIRPANKADEWEAESLNLFEKDRFKERLSLIDAENGTVHRYMAPLFVKEPCLQCHAKQNYKLGDIRGGISITMPAGRALGIREQQRQRAMLFYGGAALVIAALLHFVAARTRRHLLNLSALAGQQEILISDRTRELSVANSSLQAEIEQRKQSQNELLVSAAVMENAAEGIMVTDGDNQIVRVNPAFTVITGYRPAEVLGKNPRILSSGRHDHDFFAALWSSLEEDKRWSGDIWNRRKDGSAILCALAIATISERQSGVGRYVATFSDITQRKEAEDKLLHRASTDPLTDLPNRALFFDRLQQSLAQAERYTQTFALLYVDLDHFKAVNDNFGHAAGDQLLVETARRLEQAVRESDTVARLGGDEFAVILTQVQGQSEVEDVARRIVDDLASPFNLDAGIAHVSGSIGIAIWPNGGQDTDTLTHNADLALYEAKANGRSTYRVHNPL